MKATFTLKPGVSLVDGLECIKKAMLDSQRIENDVHTNKHYELIKGKISKKGDGVGLYWELLCNSRKAHRQAQEMMRT